VVKPRRQRLCPRLDPVDVEGGDLHRERPPAERMSGMDGLWFVHVWHVALHAARCRCVRRKSNPHPRGAGVAVQRHAPAGILQGEAGHGD
jgi:hypothetical protein